MRIRKPFAGGFAGLLVLSAYLGLAPSTIPTYKQSDKVLHFVTFFLLTSTFYWIFEGPRRRILQLTLLVCTFILGVGSEVVQGLLPNGRFFDEFDILANVVGSIAALALCTWYHKRMLERKRQRKYDTVPGDEPDMDRDVELGGGVVGAESSEESAAIVEGGKASQTQSVQEELDNWDENADEDWDAEDPPLEPDGNARMGKPETRDD